MKHLINSVKRAFVLAHIKLLDRRYIKLSRHLDWYDEQLQMNRKYAEQNRTNTMLHRNRLRAELSNLGGN
ncbi:hypothetical protein [Undibacterium sp.]|uniref:hypothetical protein n=1 Tax=Undibacterium sp. TaxID=1914977 RepID=UPI00272FFED5|nr:hypothetical protein [Undibacterium sp.]MDP1980503.1 hypothetical protein [Undibacterium sp.]